MITNTARSLHFNFYLYAFLGGFTAFFNIYRGPFKVSVTEINRIRECLKPGQRLLGLDIGSKTIGLALSDKLIGLGCGRARWTESFIRFKVLQHR